MENYNVQFKKMQDIINKIMVETNAMHPSVALSGFMMLIEEYCRANHLDMVDTFENLVSTCIAVNEELGAYV